MTTSPTGKPISLVAYALPIIVLLAGFSYQSGADALRLFFITTLLAVAFAATSMTANKRGGFSKPDMGVLYIGAAGLVATLFSHSIGVSWVQLLIFGALPLSYFMFKPLVEQFREGEQNAWFWGILGVSVLFSITGIKQHLAGGFVYGPFFDINLFSGFLSLGLFIGTARLLFSKDKPIILAVILVMLSILVYTKSLIHSRGSLLALVVTGAIFFAFVLRAEGISQKLKKIGAIAFLIGLMLTAPLAINRIINPSVDQSASSRSAMWKATVELIADNPAGYGLGTWHRVYPSYRPAADAESSGDQAHSDYLQGMAEGGVPLLVGLLLIPIMLLVKFKTWYYSKEFSYLELGLACGAFALTLQAVVNFVFSQIGLNILFGFILAVLFRNSPVIWNLNTRITKAISGILGASLAWLSITGGIGFMTINAAVLKEQSDELKSFPALGNPAFVKKIADANPLDARAKFSYGIMTTDVKEGYAYLSKAVALDPLDPGLLQAKAIHILKNKNVFDINEAYTLMDKALALNPTYWPAAHAMTIFLVAERPNAVEAISRLKKTQQKATIAPMTRKTAELLIADVVQQASVKNVDSIPPYKDTPYGRK